MRRRAVALVFFIPSLLFLLGGRGAASGLTVQIEPNALPQGGVGWITVEAPEPVTAAEGSLDTVPVTFGVTERERRVVGLVGVDLNAPPERLPLRLEVRGASGTVYRHAAEVAVEPVEFPVQRLTLPKGMVDLDPETLARVRREQARLKELWQRRGESHWRPPFAPPLRGELTRTGIFGLRRLINEQPRQPHSGVDYRAAMGTPVYAVNGGIVAYAGEMFFSGKSVILDHGGGLFTMYYHLSRLDVATGAEVARGERIGLVGATGRATGPHLHFGARLGPARIDPESLLATFPPDSASR